MEEKILNFPKQFAYEPVIENGLVHHADAYVVAGMGGSHLGAGLLKIARPALDIVIHKDYGLPSLSDTEYQKRLFIASSYSGNTEETIDALENALSRGMQAGVMTRGGTLLSIAQEKHLPHIVLPTVDMQPRFALGYQVLALAKLLGLVEVSVDLARLATELNPGILKDEGSDLARKLVGKIPVIYASRANGYLAYIWKIKINESVKIPAFANSLPEANHNEMNGFDTIDLTRDMATRFSAVFLRDSADDPRIAKRMDVTRDLYRERGVEAYDVAFEGPTVWHKIFNATLLADWMTLSLAQHYGTEPEQVPMIEQFKNLIS